MDLSRLHGIFPPVLTPLHEDQRIDHESLASLVEYLLGEGVHGIWAMGTTGEFACFDADERESAIRTTVEAVRGRVPIIANIGDASTLLSIEHAKRAARLGVDAIAATPPYYYPNNEDELDGYYRQIRDAVDLPLLLYHIPQTVKVKVTPPFVRKLAKDGVIVGLKDSQNDLEWYRRVLYNAKHDGVDLRCYLGTTGLIDTAVYAGGAGAIPGIANVTASACVGAYEAARAGNMAEATRHQERVIAAAQLATVVKGASMTGSNFAAMKAFLVARGVIKTATCRAPFRTPTADEARRAAEIISEATGVTV
jgi:4-hydroxy-tetrahydrodipicolinate synthase